MHRRENSSCDGKQTTRIPATRMLGMGGDRPLAWHRFQPKPNLHLDALLTPKGMSWGQTLSGFSSRTHGISFSAKQPCWHPHRTHFERGKAPSPIRGAVPAGKHPPGSFAMIPQLFHQSQAEILCEAHSPGWLREQPTASSPQPGLYPQPRQSILLPPYGTDICFSVLLVTPPACCGAKRRTSAPSLCQRFFTAPGTAPAKKKHTEGRKSGEPQEMLSRAQTAANLLGTRGRVRMARTHGFLGSTFPRHGSLSLNLGQGEGSCACGHNLPSISQPGSRVQDQLRLLSARHPEAETLLIHLPC